MKNFVTIITAALLLVGLAACNRDMAADSTPEMGNAESEGIVEDVPIKLMFKTREAIGSVYETVVIMENSSDKEYTYGAEQRLELLEGSEWTEVHDKQSFVTMQVFTLAPNSRDEMVFNFENHYDELKDGKYRIVKNFVGEDGERLQTTLPFKVGR